MSYDSSSPANCFTRQSLQGLHKSYSFPIRTERPNRELPNIDFRHKVRLLLPRSNPRCSTRASAAFNRTEDRSMAKDGHMIEPIYLRAFAVIILLLVAMIILIASVGEKEKEKAFAGIK